MPASNATLDELLRPLKEDPEHAAVLLDVDGVLAPIVSHPDDAHMPESTRRPLIDIAKRYGVVACVSGRRASDARRVVSLGSIAYLGSHGSEILRPGSISTEMDGELQAWTRRVQNFAREHYSEELRRLRVRLEDKEAIAALHWREVPDEEEAEAAIREVAEAAEKAGFNAHWGRKVLEIRPPVRIDKGAGIVSLLRDTELAAARLRRRRHHGPRRLPRPRRARRAGLAEAGAAGRRHVGRDAARARGGRRRDGGRHRRRARPAARAHLVTHPALALRRLPQGDGHAQRGRGDAARGRSR